MPPFEQILVKARKEPISREEASALLYATNENITRTLELFNVASKVRDDEAGTVFKITAGIASVLTCSLSPMCSYCGLFLEDRNGLNIEEISSATKYIEDLGIRDLHLSGGTTLGSEGKEVVEIVRAIRAQSAKSRVTVNVGAALSRDSIIELKKLGVIGIGSAFETINRDLFRELKSGDSFEAKQHLAEMVRDTGLQLESGLIAGLGSGSSRFEDYVNFFFHLKEFDNLGSIYVSRFNPTPQTPMQNHPECSLLEAARIVAVMRLVFRSIDISGGNGWGYNEIPLLVMAGGGNRALGVRISRSLRRRDTPNNEEPPNGGLEIKNVTDTVTGYLKEMGMSSTF